MNTKLHRRRVRPPTKAQEMMWALVAEIERVGHRARLLLSLEPGDDREKLRRLAESAEAVADVFRNPRRQYFSDGAGI